MSLEQQSSLPEFEAVMKSESLYAIDRATIEALYSDSLRRVSSIADIEHLWIVNGDKSFYSGVLQRIGLLSFYNFIKENYEKYDGWRDNGTKYRSDSYMRTKKPVLFPLDRVLIVGDEVVMLSTDKNSKWEQVKFKLDIKEFLRNWVKAITFYNKKIDQAIELSRQMYSTSPKQVDGYNIEHIAWETTKVSKSGCVDISIDGINFDVLPAKKKYVEGSIIANFKPTYVEFFSLSEQQDNGQKQIRLTKYIHKNVDYIDYGKYGTCLSASLDPNKNFVVGIFENNGKRSLSIFRLLGDASLMAEFENIDSLVGFDSEMDIIVYDNSGKLRKIDANFNNFAMYTDEKVFSLNTDQDEELSTVVGSCKTYPEMFQSGDFGKALSIALSQNSLVEKSTIRGLIDKIGRWELVRLHELQDLMHIVHPDNKSLEKDANHFIDKLRVTKPVGSKRDAPLNNLILQDEKDDPDAKKVLVAYHEYLSHYPHVVDADQIIVTWPFSHVIARGRHSLEYKKWDGYESIIQWADALTIDTHPWIAGSYLLEYTKDGMKWTLTISAEGTITKTIITADKYRNTPTFDEKNIGLAQDKTTGDRLFVTLQDNTIKEISTQWFATVTHLAHWIYACSKAPDSNFCIPNADWELTMIPYTDFNTRVEVKESSIYVIMFLDKDKKECVLIKNGDKVTTQELLGKRYDWNLGYVNDHWSFLRTIEGDDKVWKNQIICYQIMKNGELVESKGGIINLLKYEPWKYAIGTNATNELIGYELSDKSRDTVTEKNPTFLGYKNNNTNNFLVYDANKKISMYELKDNHIVPVDALAVAKVVEMYDTSSNALKAIGQVVINNNKFILTATKEGRVKISPYTSLWDPVVYNWVTYQRFLDTNNMYGVWRVVNGLREEVHPAIATTKPSLNIDSLSFNNETYNLNSLGEFVKFEHEYDVLEATEEAGYYVVWKKGLYGFAKKHEGKLEQVGELALSEKPEFSWDRAILKKWEVYLLVDRKAVGKVWYTPRLTSKYKPNVDYLDSGYIAFEIPEKGYTLIKFEEILNWQEKKINEGYKKIIRQENSWLSFRSYFVLEKDDGSCDFIIDQKLILTNGSSRDLRQIRNDRQIEPYQSLFSWVNQEGKIWLYFHNKWVISKVSQGSYTYCELEYEKEVEIRDVKYKEYLFLLTQNSLDINKQFEYILVRDLLNDSYIWFYRPKKGKKEYLLEDFDVKDKQLWFSGKNAWMLTWIFVVTKKPLWEEEFENYENFEQ